MKKRVPGKRLLGTRKADQVAYIHLNNTLKSKTFTDFNPMYWILLTITFFTVLSLKHRLTGAGTS